MTDTPALVSSPSLAAMIDGYLTTQLLYLAAALQLPDHLAAGPQSSHELALRTGVDSLTMHRLLRGLAAEGVLDEQSGATFALTDLGQPLRSDHPQSLRGAALARGALYFTAAAQLLPALQAGEIPFDHAYGQPLFDYLSANPSAESAFQHSMAARAARDRADLLAAYDFAGVRHVVDVGGGSGAMLTAILNAHPHLQATLMDRPRTISLARAELASQGVLERVSLVADDFFNAVPTGGDCYLLSRVLHDWDDARALRILEVCHAAMIAGDRLLLLEAALPERVLENPAAIRMDLHMLLLLPGRERTAAEFAGLLRAAGFRVERVLPAPSGSGVHVIEAIREAG
jgi:hypothetical protein